MQITGVQLGVMLFNHSDVDFEIKMGDRITLLILVKMITPDVYGA